MTRSPIELLWTAKKKKIKGNQTLKTKTKTEQEEENYTKQGTKNERKEGRNFCQFISTLSQL